MHVCDYTVITMVTRTRIVRIGNSQGIRVPKPLLDQAQLPEEVELFAEPGRLIVRAARGPRDGWADAAQAMRARGEDGLIDEPTETTFDTEEWTW
jgi:antitoxin MazE